MPPRFRGRADVRDLREGTGAGGGCGVSSYTKWDRAGYIERAGGPRSEQRRKALMAQQSGDRPADVARQEVAGHPRCPAVWHRGHRRARLTAMAPGTDSTPEDESADDESAAHYAEDREQPWVPAAIPDDEPEDDVLEQRQEVP